MQLHDLISLLAQAAPAAQPPSPATVALAGKVVVLSGTIAAVLQGLKKLVPGIQGPAAVVVSVLAALAAAYAAAPTGQVFSVDFFVTAIGSALGANGIHSFLRSPVTIGK